MQDKKDNLKVIKKGRDFFAEDDEYIYEDIYLIKKSDYIKRRPLRIVCNFLLGLGWSIFSVWQFYQGFFVIADPEVKWFFLIWLVSAALSIIPILAAFHELRDWEQGKGEIESEQ